MVLIWKHLKVSDLQWISRSLLLESFLEKSKNSYRQVPFATERITASYFFSIFLFPKASHISFDIGWIFPS